MLSKKLALDVINKALSTGADFAEIYYQEILRSSVSIENEKVDASGTSTTCGVGLRLLKGLRSVYGHTDDLSKQSLMRLAEDLSASFDGKQDIKVEKFAVKHIRSIHKIEIPYETVSKEEIIERLREMSQTMADFDKKIVRRNTGFFFNIEKIVIFNSNSKEIITDKIWARMFCSCVAADEGKVQSEFSGPGTQAGWEFFTKTIDTKKVAEDTAALCMKMLNADEAPAGKMPVIIGSGWGGVLFHEACGHPLETSGVSKGLSCFTPDMIGTKVASDVVSAYDDGTLPNEWGSTSVDDEGNPSQKVCLIKNGVLQGFMSDAFTGRRMNYKENGHSRRQNYKFEPVARMTNTYIANGKSTKEEIIANTKLALYCVSFGGGSVNPTTGEFNFGASEAYIVRDGKICEPVRGATLIGKGSEILKQIDMVANDCAFGQGMCGAGSGSIPVNVGQPTIRLKEILVGGRGGALK